MRALEAELAVGLELLRASGRGRSRSIVESRAAGSTRLRVGDREYLAFCSNDYLGLADHPGVTEAFVDAGHRWGVGSGASHLVSGHTREHHALEEELAEFTARPRALLFSTGYMANLAVVRALAGRGGVVHEDRLNHASLIDAGLASGARLRRYPHRDAEALRGRITAPRVGRTLVATDGVFSMDGDVAPLAQSRGGLPRPRRDPVRGRRAWLRRAGRTRAWQRGILGSRQR